MKKVVIIAMVCLIGIPSVFARNPNTFFKLSLGTGYLMDAKIEDTPLIMFEFGKNYNWLDLSVSLDYVNRSLELPYGVVDAYPRLTGGIKSNVDFIKMFFGDTRHALKLGAGIGLSYSGKYDFNSQLESPNKRIPVVLACSLLLGYEFRVTDNSWIGPFFTMSSSGNYVGLSFRQDF